MPKHALYSTKMGSIVEHLDPTCVAEIKAMEEAVVNALVAGAAVYTFKPAARIRPAIDTGRLRETRCRSWDTAHQAKGHNGLFDPGPAMGAKGRPPPETTFARRLTNQSRAVFLAQVADLERRFCRPAPQEPP